MIEFVFSSFWTFLGTLILIMVVLAGVVDIINAIKRK